MCNSINTCIHTLHWFSQGGYQLSLSQKPLIRCNKEACALCISFPIEPTLISVFYSRHLTLPCFPSPTPCAPPPSSPLPCPTPRFLSLRSGPPHGATFSLWHRILGLRLLFASFVTSSLASSASSLHDLVSPGPSLPSTLLSILVPVTVPIPVLVLVPVIVPVIVPVPVPVPVTFFFLSSLGLGSPLVMVV